MPPCTLPPARNLSAPLVPPLSVVHREFLEIKFPRLTVPAILFVSSFSRFFLFFFFFLLVFFFYFFSSLSPTFPRNTLRTPVYDPISTVNNESLP